jgi:hypothetical protein
MPGRIPQRPVRRNNTESGFACELSVRTAVRRCRSSWALSSTPAVSFRACGGAGSCTVLSDESGQVSTFVGVLAAGTMAINATLASASSSNPKSVQSSLLGISSASDISVTLAAAWVAQGATLDLSLSSCVLSNGTPTRGSTVLYRLVKGSATLTSASAATDSNGYANTTLQIAGLNGDVQVSACVQPANKPCHTFSATAVPASA